MKVIVVGCGQVGAELAYRLYQQGHQVVVVDEQSAAFDHLPADFRGRIVEGNPLARDVLRQAGIEHADSLAAVSSSDSLNAVVAHVARTVYHVPQVVVRNNNVRWRPLYETFGLQVVSPAGWEARRIEELLGGSSLRPVFSAGHGEVEIYEFVVPEHWHGRALQELLPPGQGQVVAVTRAGRAMLPTPQMALESGDIVHLSAGAESVQTLCRWLDAGREV